MGVPSATAGGGGGWLRRQGIRKRERGVQRGGRAPCGRGRAACDGGDSRRRQAGMGWLLRQHVRFRQGHVGGSASFFRAMHTCRNVFFFPSLLFTGIQAKRSHWVRARRPAGEVSVHQKHSGHSVRRPSKVQRPRSAAAVASAAGRPNAPNRCRWLGCHQCPCHVPVPALAFAVALPPWPGRIGGPLHGYDSGCGCPHGVLVQLGHREPWPRAHLPRPAAKRSPFTFWPEVGTRHSIESPRESLGIPGKNTAL